MAIIAMFVLAPAGVSYAEGEAESTETTIGFESGREPAVVLPTDAAEVDDPAWTFRYLVPTLLVASGAALLGVFIWYGLGVKGRYRVVR